MARRVRLSVRAGEDLRRIVAWYSQAGSGRAATLRLQRIERAIDDIAESPCSYPLAGFAGTRQMIREHHRFIFLLLPDTRDNATAGDALVLRILGPGQNDR